METIKIGSFEINAHSWSPDSSKPVILFIHGASLSKDFWNAQINGLSNESYPVAVDLPGHGGSGGPAKDKISDYADDIIDFITQAELSHCDLVLCGLSMGGGIVQHLIIHYPDLFKAAILINTGARLKVHPMIIESVKTDFHGFIQSMPSYSLSPSTDVTLYEKQIHAITSRSEQQTALKDFAACNTFDVMEKIERITCPVLVLSAAHDVSTPPKYGYWLSENIPHAEHVHIEHAGHLSPIEKSDRVNEAIKDFLNRRLG